MYLTNYDIFIKICMMKREDTMKKISSTLQKMIEKNKREILSNQSKLSDIEKKVDTKIIANGK